MARERSHLLRSWLFSSLLIWHLLSYMRHEENLRILSAILFGCEEWQYNFIPYIRRKTTTCFLVWLSRIAMYCQVLSASIALQRWPPSWRTSNLTHHGKKGPDIAYFVYKWNFLCGSSGIVFRNQALCQSLAKHLSSAFHHAFFKILLKLLSKTVHNAFNLHRVRWNN